MMRLDGQVCMIPVPPAAHPEKQTIEPVKWYSTPHGHSNSIISITVRSWVKVGVGDGQKLGSLGICNGVVGGIQKDPLYVGKLVSEVVWVN